MLGFTFLKSATLMATRCKGFNSKCFLFTYLIIVGFILVLWVNWFAWVNNDRRDIPAELQSFLESPPRPLPKLFLKTNNKSVLTNDWFVGKWTFVYFSHGNCLPLCRASLEQMKTTQQALANSDVQFLIVGLDAEHETTEGLSQFLHSQGYSFTVATTTVEATEELATLFRALFLQTDFTDSSYLIEQEHSIFMVDPKGRVYATFRSPYVGMRSHFFTLRHFFAQTE